MKTYSFLHRPAFWMLIGLVVRLSYLFEQSLVSPSFYSPILDELEAVHSAEVLLGKASEDRKPFFKAPLYSWVMAGSMALAGEGWPSLLRFVQHLCGTLLIGLAFQSAQLLGRHRFWAGPVAAALLVAYAPLIRLEDRLVLDFFVVFFQSAMLWALLRALQDDETKPFAWLALAAGLAAVSWLTRPTLLPLLPLLALLLFWQWPGASRRTRMAVVVVFVLPLLLCLSAFGARNARVSGERLFLPWQGGYSFYHANRQGANGRYFLQERFDVSDSANPAEGLMLQEWQAAHPGRTVNYGELNDWWMQKGWAAFAEDPAGRSFLLFQKSIYLLSSKEIYNFEDFDFALEQSRLLPLYPVRAGVLIPLAFAGLALLARMDRRAAWLVLTYTVGLAGLIALFYTSGRMRMPLVFPFALIAGAGLSALRPPDPRQLVLAFTGLCVGLVLTWGNWWGVRTDDFRYVDYGRLSAALLEQGQAAAALEAVAHCETLKADYPQIPLMKGLALFALEREAEALEQLYASVKRLPQDPVAPFNIGLILWRTSGDSRKALEWFDESLQRAPTYANARWMRARMLVAEGDRKAASDILLPALQSGEATPRFLVSAVLFFRADGAEDAANEIAKPLLERFGEDAETLVEEEWERLRFEGWGT